MSKTSTPDRENLITPEAARHVWAQWLPDAPESGTALLRRTERGTGPPCHMVRGPGPGKRLYHPLEVARWCIAQMPETPRLLLSAFLGDAEVLFYDPDRRRERKAGLHPFLERGVLRVALDDGKRGPS